MANSKQPDPKFLFTNEQYQKLLGILKAKNLIFEVDAQPFIKNTLKEFPHAPGDLFYDAYTYIAGLITGNEPGALINGKPSAADEDTRVWFSKAPAINRDEKLASAANFIRGVTQFGLLQAGKLGALSQDEINRGLQKTSNVIGEKVFAELLFHKGVPDFKTLISNDISAAIGTGAPEGFRQNPGGWAGAFYYWNAPLRPEHKVTVGNAILLGDEFTDSKGNNMPSDTEFFYANSNGLADFVLSHDHKGLMPNKQGVSPTLRAIHRT